MIDVRLPREQNLDVLKVKTKLFDAGLNQWNRFFKSAVDQKMASRGSDQERCEIARADVIDICDDTVGREGLVLFQRNLAKLRLRQAERAGEKQSQSHRSIIGADRPFLKALHGAIWSAAAFEWRLGNRVIVANQPPLATRGIGQTTLGLTMPLGLQSRCHAS